MAILHWKQG